VTEADIDLAVEILDASLAAVLERDADLARVR
jgi:hypothetical protein